MHKNEESGVRLRNQKKKMQFHNPVEIQKKAPKYNKAMKKCLLWDGFWEKVKTEGLDEALMFCIHAAH